jgi:hypothetical protein
MEIEMIFLFKVIIVVGTSKLCISLIKKALNISSQRDETPRFLNNYMRLVIFIDAPMTCLMFTAFAETKIKLIFVAWLAVIVAVCFLIKSREIRFHVSMVFSILYGLILAIWYFAHPLEGRYGDNGIEENLAILLSAVMVMLPIYMIDYQESKND